ncbi:CPBP family intramembrane metalloprotease [Candidatus Bathyarchaeota archaeon]|nr:CPBP family intramembrane metalloprotease [Candidatus Bathyarchaeota archaeon]
MSTIDEYAGSGRPGGGVWGAKSSLACFIVVVAGVLVVSIATSLALTLGGVSLKDPQYPLSLVSIPVNESAILLLTMLFVRRSKASLSALGFKRVSATMAFGMALLALAMLFSAATVAWLQNAILGSDPSEEAFTRLVTPRDPAQLLILITFSMVLVGPVEELFFRGYVQKGFEDSLGRVKGWILASLLFGLMHGLNVVRAIAPTLVAGLFLGFIWQRLGRNTTAVAIMHGIYDSIALTLSFLAGP